MHLNREKIKLIMARKKITFVDIANKCEVSRQRIGCIFNSVNVTPRTVGLLADALEVDVTEILKD